MAEKPSSFPIKTVVVLVQENRSFNHMLGWMKELNPKIDGVVAGGHEFSNPLNTSDPNSTRINFGDGSVFCCGVKLSEPVRLRDFDAKEEKQLSEFQGEMVQLAACLRGDHSKATYPDKLVESMNVVEAAEYCTKSFNIFLKECEKANKIGADQTKVVEVVLETIQSSGDEQKVTNKEGLNDNRSFFVKLISCFL